MKLVARSLAVVFAAVLAAGASDALAHGHGHGRGHWSGSRSSGWHGGWHHHRHGVFITGFYFGAPWYAWEPFPYWYGPPFYYAPDYAPRAEPPTVYIEKFDGDPASDTQDFILCPSSDTAYPETKVCPGGWARALPAPAQR